MAQMTLQRPTGRVTAASLRARRAGDLDDSRRRPVLTFRRSTWSAYLESQMFGAEWAERRERG